MAVPEPSEGDARLEIDGATGVATVTLSRPARRNALSAPMVRSAVNALEVADADPAVRAVLLTGEPPAFCAGADLGDFDETPGRGGFLDAYHALVDRIGGIRQPVIGFANGPALGAGCQLLCQCDLMIAAESAPIGIPASRIGLMLDPVNLNALVTEIGPHAARQLLLTGVPVAGHDALRLGLVHRVVPDETAAADALAWAEHVAAQAPLSVQGHKQAVRHIVRSWALDPAAAGYTHTTELWQGVLGSADLREGVASFGERRPPEFRGE